MTPAASVIAEETQKRSFFSRASIHYTARTFLSVRFSESLQGFADARCVFLPPHPPFPSYSLPPSPPRWFLHGRRLSIRASGLQEPESTAASLCCPEKRSLVWGGASAAPRGRRVNPGAPLASWLHWKVSSPHLFLQGQRSACFSLCGGAFG